MYQLDTRELFQRLVKYLMEGFVVGFVAYLLPSKGISAEEAVMIALTASAMFALLDYLAPTIGNSARNGAGLGLGFGLVGFPA